MGYSAVQEHAGTLMDKQAIAALLGRLVVVCAANWAVGVLVVHLVVDNSYVDYSWFGNPLFGLMQSWSAEFADGSSLGNCVMQTLRNQSCVNENLNGTNGERASLERTDAAFWWQNESYAPWGTAINMPPWSPENRGY